MVKNTLDKILRILHSAVWWVDWAVLVVVGIFLDTFIWPGNKEKYRASERFWAWTLMKLGGIKLDISGQENLPKDETVVYMANHQSDLDWPIIFMAIPGQYLFVAKKELFDAPVFGTYMRIQGYLPINRGNIRSSVNTFQNVIYEINEGNSIVIYPEGTRSYTEKLQKFKAFSFAFLKEAKVRVVPVAIDGSSKVQRKGSKLVHPGTVKVTILPPVSFEDIHDLDVKEFSLTASKRVRESLLEVLEGNGTGSQKEGVGDKIK